MSIFLELIIYTFGIGGVTFGGSFGLARVIKRVNYKHQRLALLRKLTQSPSIEHQEFHLRRGL